MLHLLFCKKKSTKRYTSFFVVKNGMTNAAIVIRKVVITLPINPVKNYKVPTDEQVYCIPVEEFIHL